jgi:hypothetical protein
MTTTINAQATNGLLTTADGSGIVKLQSNGVTTNALMWINYNGSSPGVRASYIASSVTKNSTGNYTISLSSTLSDTNFSTVGIANGFASFEDINAIRTAGRTTSSLTIAVVNGGATTYVDTTGLQVALFGN